jgi:hypothetical protein
MKEPNVFGFTSVEDFMESFLRLKQWTFNATGALMATMGTFITGYMWDSEAAVWTLWALMGADWMTGIGKSIKNGEFVSYKIFRMPIYYVATSFIISITWWMGKANLIFVPLPAIAMGGFYAVYFSSLLENMAELELLPPKMIKLLERFGMKVIINKYFNNGKDS